VEVEEVVEVKGILQELQDVVVVVVASHHSNRDNSFWAFSHNSRSKSVV
jgi:hypothetical protein